jgi:hypothetical protein
MSKNRLIMTMVIKLGMMAFFIGCIGKQPYGYYQAVRTIALIGFASLCYQYIVSQQYLEIIPSLAGVVLFNPVNKISFHRDVWQQIDFWLAIILGVWAAVDFIKYFLTLRNEKRQTKKTAT